MTDVNMREHTVNNLPGNHRDKLNRLVASSIKFRGLKNKGEPNGSCEDFFIPAGITASNQREF